MNHTLAKGRNELVVKLYNAGNSPEKIAKIIDCCTDNVYKILRKRGVKFRGRKFTNEELCALLMEGKSQNECAQIFGVGQGTVSNRIKRIKNEFPSSASEDKTQSMQRLRENGYTNEEIARRMGVSVVTVYRYIGNQPEEITRASIEYATQLCKLKARRLNSAKMALLRKKQEEERIKAERRAAEEAARREKEALEKSKREIYDTVLSIGFPQELATSASSIIETAAQGAAILDNMKKKFAAAPAVVH